VPVIVDLVAELDLAMPKLLALAAAQDAAPSAAGDDHGPREGFERRWRGVRAWFLSDGDQAPIAESLRVAMLDALNRILIAVTRLNERELRRASREADFDALARWFAAAETDNDAHQLWDAAFGAYPARHFTELAGDEEVERRRSFWDADPATIAPRLRATGSRASPGRPGPVADYSAAKAARVAAVRAARARATAAAARLAARTPCRVSALGSVDADEFDQVLAMLSAGLASHAGADGIRHARTPYGQVFLGEANSDETGVVETPHGRFHTPDLYLEVRAVGRDTATASAEEAAG
jgi:uncharacterized protein (TIGR02677 family)